MLVNAQNLQNLTRSFRALAMTALFAAMPRWNQVAMLVPSSTASNDYGWLTEIPGAREWIGERELKNLSNATYNVVNQDFELTVSVKRNNIEDDNIGIYSPMFSALGESFAYSPDEIVFRLLKNGFTEKCYDGKAFFASNHKVGSKQPAQSNLGDGKLTRDRFRAALTVMQSQVRENGQPLRVFMGEGAQAPLLIVGPSNRALALEIVGIQTLAAGGDNPDYKTATILVLPELTGAAADNWFLLDTSKAVKPMILQRRQEQKFVAMDAETDENVFMRKEFRYGFDDRKAAGFAFWQLAYGSTGAVV